MLDWSIAIGLFLQDHRGFTYLFWEVSELLAIEPTVQVYKSGSDFFNQNCIFSLRRLTALIHTTFVVDFVGAVAQLLQFIIPGTLGYYLI